jgi:hypothetical protein
VSRLEQLNSLLADGFPKTSVSPQVRARSAS